MKNYREIDLQVGMPRFVVERAPDPNWGTINRLNPDFYVLGYAKSGEAFYNIGNDSFTVSKGHVVFMQPKICYTNRSNPENPWSFYSCGFTMSAGDLESERLIAEFPSTLRCSDSSRLSENFSELNRIWMMRSKGYKLKCRSLILDILFILMSDEDRRRMHSAHFDKLNKIIDLMRENYDRSYSLDELCELSELSSSHFRQLFKQLTGMSVVQFQNHLKIEKAKDLLLSENCSVTEAAHNVGFSDIYYFSRMFKKLTGTNPSDYRQ